MLFPRERIMRMRDVLIFSTDEDRMFRDTEQLLAGDVVEKVTLPDTMEELGRYVFYGCRNLKTLCFSDRLKNIGSGAFTGCRGSVRICMPGFWMGIVPACRRSWAICGSDRCDLL